MLLQPNPPLPATSWSRLSDEASEGGQAPIPRRVAIWYGYSDNRRRKTAVGGVGSCTYADGRKTRRKRMKRGGKEGRFMFWLTTSQQYTNALRKRRFRVKLFLIPTSAADLSRAHQEGCQHAQIFSPEPFARNKEDYIVGVQGLGAHGKRGSAVTAVSPVHRSHRPPSGLCLFLSLSRTFLYMRRV